MIHTICIGMDNSKSDEESRDANTVNNMDRTLHNKEKTNEYNMPRSTTDAIMTTVQGEDINYRSGVRRPTLAQLDASLPCTDATWNRSSSRAPLPGLNMPERRDITSSSQSECMSSSDSEKCMSGEPISRGLRSVGLLAPTENMSEKGDWTREDCIESILAWDPRSDKCSIEPNAVLYKAGTSGVDALDAENVGDLAPMVFGVTAWGDATDCIDIGVGSRGEETVNEFD